MFGHITSNWRAVPLVSREVIVERIAHTKTEKRLTIRAELDTKTAVTGSVVPQPEFAALALTRNEFHGEGNDRIRPRTAGTD